MKCSAWVLDDDGNGYPCLVQDCTEHALPAGVTPLPPHPTGCDNTRRLNALLALQKGRGIKPPTADQVKQLRQHLAHLKETK